MSEFPEVDNRGRSRTPYAVVCEGPWDLPGYGHGIVYLTEQEYSRQLSAASARWKCPLCRYEAVWSDDNYDEMCERAEQPTDRPRPEGK